jgi:hypothetical protein
MTQADRPPRDLADRIIRQTLPKPAHLRAFLQEVVPDLAAGFDCDRARELDPNFPLPDWRRREADLPFEIPYRTGAEELLALVCILIEHQSDTDPLMPLRMLFFAVMYWDRQWTEWEALPRPRPPLRLRPVLPIVLYTGRTPWGSNRTLADLLGEPQAFHAFAPTWQPLFWNLSERTPQALLDSGAEWLQMLAVMRATDADAPEFQRVYGEAMRRFQAVHPLDAPRWTLLAQVVMDWGHWRRPAAERAALLAEAVASQTNPVLQKKVEAMGQTIAESLIEEGVVKGQLSQARTTLRRLLISKFGVIPESVLQRIESTTDLAQLDAVTEQVLRMESLDELKL